MLNKKAIMEDWFQVIFFLFVMAVASISDFFITNHIITKTNQYGDQSIEKIESSRILLEYLSSTDDNNRKAIDLLSIAISNNDYTDLEKYTKEFFSSIYKDPSKISWMLRVETNSYLEIKDKNFDSAGSKTRLTEIKVSMPNGDIAKFSLHTGKDIGVV